MSISNYAMGGDVAYHAPQVTDYGTLEQLTAGQSSGNQTDAAFGIGTLKGKLTFS